MVDENGEGGSSSKMPAAFNAKPLKLEPGMHHMEKLDDSAGSLEEDMAAAKANGRRGSDTRKNRMAEINRLDTFKNPNHKPSLHQANGGLEFNAEAAKDQHLFQHNLASRQQHHQQHLQMFGNHVSTRTFQPIKGFDIQDFLAADKSIGSKQGAEVVKAKEKKPAPGFLLLKTYRNFSDHLDEVHEVEQQIKLLHDSDDKKDNKI